MTCLSACVYCGSACMFIHVIDDLSKVHERTVLGSMVGTTHIDAIVKTSEFAFIFATLPT